MELKMLTKDDWIFFWLITRTMPSKKMIKNDMPAI